MPFEDEQFFDEFQAKNRTRPTTRAVLEALKDGEWHRREDIVRQVLHTVPPGQAVRSWQKTRLAARTALAKKTLDPEQFARWQEEAPEAQPDWKNPHRPVTEHDQIFSGQRAIATDAIHATKRVESKTDENGVKWIRRTPLSPRITGASSNLIRMRMVEQAVQRKVQEKQ